MRYRKLDEGGDYAFGHGPGDFWRDQPEAVVQAAATRLRLWTGQWFLDAREGTEWQTRILGAAEGGPGGGLYDIELQSRIAGTPGVLSLDAYASRLDGPTRALSVEATLTTAYGQASAIIPSRVSAPLGVPAPGASALIGPDGEALLGAEGIELSGPLAG